MSWFFGKKQLVGERTEETAPKNFGARATSEIVKDIEGLSLIRERLSAIPVAGLRLRGEVESLVETRCNYAGREEDVKELLRLAKAIHVDVEKAEKLMGKIVMRQAFQKYVVDNRELSVEIKKYLLGEINPLLFENVGVFTDAMIIRGIPKPLVPWQALKVLAEQAKSGQAQMVKSILTQLRVLQDESVQRSRELVS